MKPTFESRRKAALAALSFLLLAGFVLIGGCAKGPKPMTYLDHNEPATTGTRSLELEVGQMDYGSAGKSVTELAPERGFYKERSILPAEGFSPTTRGRHGSDRPDMTPATRPKPTYKQSGGFYSQAEELWVISRPVAERGVDAESPGTGALVSKEGDNYVPLPLKHTDVKASVSGYVASVHVTQQFQNPYDSKIEAVYVFPLPENSAVNEFLMVVGDRRIRGIIRERQEAERVYREARRQGYVASLLTQERPNIFTQSVANIEPGKEIDVEISYFNTLSYMEGWFEFVFPMVVGPRFNPPATSKGVGAVARGDRGTSGQKTEIQYLHPSERSGHDIAIQVDIDAGVPIEAVECSTHLISSQRPDRNRCVAALAANDCIPNRDFVLRYRVIGEQINSGMLTHSDERGGFFSLMIYPPADFVELPRSPMEMVFVLDCSGSMSGRPIAQAKEAIRSTLELLTPADSFQVINFSSSASQLGPHPLNANPVNVRRALRYLNEIDAEGGTMMIEGIKAALDFPHDPKRLRFVCFLTDGYIGNEDEILTAIQKKLGSSRIFSFGVGSAVNRYLLDSMARLGRGAVAYLLPQTETSEVTRAFFERISHPALTDLEIDWAGVTVSEVFPKTAPDLFAGRPILLTGRYSGNLPANIIISGRTGEGRIDFPVPVLRDETRHSPLVTLWARAKITDLTQRNMRRAESSQTMAAIKNTALKYNLLSAYTAFLAVDSSRRTEGFEGTSVPVAVPVPSGVKYETTVRE